VRAARDRRAGHSERVVAFANLKGRGKREGRRRSSVRGSMSKADMETTVEDQEALDLAADWSDISQGLRKDLGQQLHSQWIKPVQLGSFCKETGTLDLF